MLRKLDLRGLKCPLPVLKTRKALAGLAPGDRIEVACTDPLSVIDLPNLVRETGDCLEKSWRGGWRAGVPDPQGGGVVSARAALAALVYEEGQEIDALFAEVRRALEARGLRVGGVVQTPCEETVHAIHIDSGRRIDLMQNSWGLRRRLPPRHGGAGGSRRPAGPERRGRTGPSPGQPIRPRRSRRRRLYRGNRRGRGRGTADPRRRQRQARPRMARLCR